MCAKPFGMRKNPIMKPLVAIAPLAFALAACSPDASGTFDDGKGGEGNYTIDQSGGETTATVTTRDGTATMKSGKDLKITLPEGFSVFPGAEVENNTSFSSPDGTGALVNMTSDASPQEMVDFYRKQAKAAGAEITLDVTKGKQMMLVGKGKDDLGFTFNAGPGDGKTTAQLMIGQGLD